MTDLIAALSTPAGRGGIGVLRLSGPGALRALEAVFSPACGRPLSLCAARALVYGDVRDRHGRLIDRGMAVAFPAPGSYTGEESGELHCHGSPMVLTLALEALFAAGARQAQPGEFTRRAFLNGRLDLTQAEAVADLIDAETPAAAAHAAGQLAGALSARLEGVYAALVDVTAHFHAVLDYPDEDIDPFRSETIAAALTAAGGELDALLATCDRGRHLTEGVPCAIAGPPNAGKSSLLNRLLGYERAIVTDLPGTTRDTVEERCTLGGVLLRLIDTAGLRHGGDAVESLGMARTRAALKAADLCFLVLDGSRPLSPEDGSVLEAADTARQVICVVNKADRPVALDLDALRARFPRLCLLSALTGEGLSALEEAVRALFAEERPAGRGGAVFLTNARQYSAALRARQAVAAAADALGGGLSPDAVMLDVEQAMSALGELTGRLVREDIVTRIFERFCVGK